jgi:hypothetical protein
MEPTDAPDCAGAAGDAVRAVRRRLDRLPGSRGGAARPGLHTFLRQYPLRLGGVALRPLLRTTRFVLAPDPVRQAWHGPLGPAARADARDADGRHPCRTRRVRVRACSAVRRGPRQSAHGRLCRYLSGADACTCAAQPARVAVRSAPVAAALTRGSTRPLGFCASTPTTSDSRQAPAQPGSSSGCCTTRTSPTSCPRSGC